MSRTDGKPILRWAALGAAVSVGVKALAVYGALAGEEDTTSIADIRQAATAPHFARIQGVGDGLQETGVSLDPALAAKVDYAASVVEDVRTDETARDLDMTWSEGRLEAVNGEWSSEALSEYANRVIELDEGIAIAFNGEVGSLSGEVGKTEAERSVTVAMGRGLLDARHPDLAFAVEPGAEDGSGSATMTRIRDELASRVAYIDRSAHGAEAVFGPAASWEQEPEDMPSVDF